MRAEHFLLCGYPLSRTAESSRRRAAGTHPTTAARGRIHTLVILDIARTFLAETPQIVGKLQHVVTSDDTVRRILRPARTGRTNERLILVENIVHTEHDFTPFVSENFLTDIGVTKQIIVVVIVRKTGVLRIGSTGRQRKSERKNHFQITLRRVVEIAVFRIGSGEDGVLRDVIGAVPRKGEIDVFRAVLLPNTARKS